MKWELKDLKNGVANGPKNVMWYASLNPSGLGLLPGLICLVASFNFSNIIELSKCWASYVDIGFGLYFLKKVLIAVFRIWLSSKETDCWGRLYNSE